MQTSVNYHLQQTKSACLSPEVGSVAACELGMRSSTETFGIQTSRDYT